MSRYRPQSRNDDHHPLLSGPEAAALMIGGTLVAMVLVAVGAVALAGALFGEGASWPVGGRGWLSALGAILRGDPASGYPAAAGFPARASTYTVIVIGEVTLIVAIVLGARALRSNTDSDGMASRGEAASALGLGELRKARSIIRPDLYPARRKAKQ